MLLGLATSMCSMVRANWIQNNIVLGNAARGLMWVRMREWA